MGDFSARTVITSDPNINIDEIRVPIKIAMTLTMPMIVTKQNIEELTNYVKNGKYKYPGANFVIRYKNYNDKKKLAIDLHYRKNGVILKYGDIVERHLIDGDTFLFNRQPSLHKLSMMCHKAKIINDPEINTFGLNTSVTPNYNADLHLV